MPRSENKEILEFKKLVRQVKKKKKKKRVYQNHLFYVKYRNKRDLNLNLVLKIV